MEKIIKSNSQIRSLSMRNDFSKGIPIIGLGTSLLRQELAVVLPTAFSLGYKLVDSAVDYENEQYIGEVLDTGIVRRENIFLCTKACL